MIMRDATGIDLACFHIKTNLHKGFVKITVTPPPHPCMIVGMIDI
jgi:hypothetical protein